MEPERAVVGCGECGNLWIIETHHETVSCTRCGDRKQVDGLKFLAVGKQRPKLVQARSRLLEERAQR